MARQTDTNTTRINMGRSATQKIPHAGGGKRNLQNSENTKMGKSSRTKDNRLGTNSAEQRNMERKRTIIPEENSSSSSSLKTQKDNKKKAAAKIQEIHGGLLVDRKRFCGTRVCDGSLCNGTAAEYVGSSPTSGPSARERLFPTTTTSLLSNWTLTWMVRYITNSKDFTTSRTMASMLLQEFQR